MTALLVMIIIFLGAFIYFSNISEEQNKDFRQKAFKKAEREIENLSRAKLKAKMMKDNLFEYLEIRNNVKPLPDYFLKDCNYQLGQLDYVWSNEFVEDLKKLRSYRTELHESDFYSEFISKVDNIEKEINSIKASIVIYDKYNIHFVPEEWAMLSSDFKSQLDRQRVSPLDINKVTIFKIDFFGEIDGLKIFQKLESLSITNRSIKLEDLEIILFLPKIQEVILSNVSLNLRFEDDVKFKSKVILKKFELDMKLFLKLIKAIDHGWFYSHLIIINNVRIEELNLFINKINMDLFSECQLNFKVDEYRLDNFLYDKNLSEILCFNKNPKNIKFTFKGNEFDLYQFNNRDWYDLKLYLFGGNY